MPDADAEDLIASVSGALTPADREPFRRAAEATLALSRQCLGPGSIYRALVPVWRKFFRPTRDDRSTGWDQGRQTNKLVSEPAIGRSLSRARSTDTAS